MHNTEEIIRAAKAAGAKKITIVGDRIEIDFEPVFVPAPNEYVPVWPWPQPYIPTPISPPGVPAPYTPYWEITC